MRLRTLFVGFSFFVAIAVGGQEDALRARLKSSVAVVVGTVGEPLRRVPFRGPGGEHQPDWWEAPVRVASTLSGEKQPEVIHVAFSYNYDPYWEASPKLVPGEKAIFLLHRYDARETEARIHHAFDIPPVEGFLVIDPLDVQPLKNEKRIVALSKARSAR